MESKNRTKLVMSVMNVLFWVIFIGFCIKTGALLVSFIVSFVNPAAVKNLYMAQDAANGFNLSDLYRFNIAHYIGIASFLVILTGLKAYIAYLVIKIALKFKIDYPFDARVASLITKVSYVALEAGILAFIATFYSKGLIKKGVAIPIDWGGDELLFFAGVIFIIAQVFNRGVEIQSENELTV